MQETDFAPADAFVPVDPPVLLGMDPLLLAALALLLLAVGVGMFLLGRMDGEKSGAGSDGAPADIHAAILKASREAMSADSNELRGRVQTLRDLIDKLLGPVLVIGKETSAALGDIDKALKGKFKDETHKPAHDAGHGSGHGGDGHGHGHGHGSGHGGGGGEHHAAPAGSSGGSGGGGAAAASSTVTVIGLPIHVTHSPPEPHHAPAAHSHAAHPAPHHPPAGDPPMRSMTHDEQTQALALAARKFHDYWSKSDVRVRELRAARAALSHRPAGSRPW